MNVLTVTFVIWAAVLAAFIALMIYRSQLNNHEADQLFLTDNPAEIQVEEHNRIMRLLNRIEPLCTGLGSAAAIASALLVGVYVAEQARFIRF